MPRNVMDVCNMLNIIILNGVVGLAYGLMSFGHRHADAHQDGMPRNMLNIIILNGSVGLAYGLMSEGHGAV